MKIILYCNRNVGLIALSHLAGLGHDVSVITDNDEVVEWLAERLGCEIVSFYEDWGEFDLFICVHGNKIIDKKHLVTGKFINIHPCLYKYKGHNPIRRYILNEDNQGTVESQYMIEEVDAGEVIHKEDFFTGKCSNFADFYNVALPYYYKCLDATLKKIIE